MTHSLGNVVPGAVFVRATANLSDPTATFLAHSVLFQQLPGNTGKLYIADAQNADKTQAAGLNGILAVLPIPTTNNLPSVTFTIITAPNGLGVSYFWIGSDVNGEGCQVAVMRT